MDHPSTGMLKARARGQLLSNYGTACPVCLFVLAVNFLLTLIGAFTADQSSAPGLFLFECFILLKNILLCVLEVGECLIFLKLALGQKTGFKDLFWGFSSSQERILKDALFLTLGESLFFLPVFLLAWVPLRGVFFYPLYLLCYAGAFLFRLVYSQTFYLLLDFPTRGWRELLTMSRLKMRGAKGRLFLLYLSFIPMMLLVFLSFGVGAVWVLPYMRCAGANFFLDLMRGAPAQA